MLAQVRLVSSVTINAGSLLDLKSHSFVIFMLGIMRLSAFVCFQAVFCMALSQALALASTANKAHLQSQLALPYLEQTEDWVELDQRFPVRIMIDKKDLKQHRLIPVGSSASVVIARSH